MGLGREWFVPTQATHIYQLQLQDSAGGRGRSFCAKPGYKPFTSSVSGEQVRSRGDARAFFAPQFQERDPYSQLADSVDAVGGLSVAF
jgi:hypothetical protein